MNELLSQREQSPSGLVHELFERCAAAAPRATAVRYRDQSLTYGELDQRANQLAHHLAYRGIGAESRVVVFVEPGLEIAIALLGIFKAGAVYVPLDPGYPAPRIRAILEDTKPLLVLTQHCLAPRHELDGLETLALDALPAGYSALSWVRERSAIEQSQTASIFYTSGTTGSPKGVMASYANLRHYIGVARELYRVGPRDALPALARFSFSISLFELLLPLSSGGSLHVLDRAHVLDLARLALALESVTIFHAGPSLLKALVLQIRRQAASFARFDGVRHASSGGDMVPPELLEALKEIFANAEVFVIYGCSEISCMGSSYPVPRDRRVTRTYVGRSFDGVSLRVLDDAGRALPVNGVGEVWFAGKGLTKGYLNQPELTAEKFVSQGSERFYRTGDLGRLSSDGWLELLGRSDFQVKLRGMRVELAEVELELRRAAGVRDAVAAAKPASDGENVLVAYLVLDAESGPERGKSQRLAGIRQHMADHLPDYMVPAVYVTLDALPLNLNQKLDRRALPDPSEADLRALSEHNVREPSTASERALARIWRQLLGVAKVGLDDNFFELGGHSMLAVMLSLEVEAALGVALEGMAVLREPLEVLAAICDRRRGVAGPTIAPARAARSKEVVQIFHFGEGQSLYGALHGRVDGACQRAALICAPVGQEYMRARFVLTQLARQLAELGVPTLLFDYFGCGDSLGESGLARCGRWQEDIAAAYVELGRRTNGARVTGVGVRLGALLLADAARRLDFAKLVLWDPVGDGAAYFSMLGELQQRYLRSIAPLRFWSRRRTRPASNELFGTSYPEATLRELKASSLVALLDAQRAPVVCADFNCDWSDAARLEDVIPDTRLSSTLAGMLLAET